MKETKEPEEHSKKRKENQRPSFKKKCGSKKEDLEKKTLSRNRPPAVSKTD
jgi:hypothetical protein